MARTLIVVQALALSLIFCASAWAATGTRVSSFEYDSTTGFLTKEVIEPDAGQENFCLVTEYVYDAFGNRKSAQTRNCTGASGEALFTARTSTTGWASDSGGTDASGRFPTKLTNAEGHVETRAYEAGFGGVIKLTGPNQLDTEWKYDGFGRKVLERRPDGHGTKWVRCEPPNAR